MAVRSPAHDPSWTPDGGSPRILTGETGTSGFESSPSIEAGDGAGIDLSLTRAAVQDGLLMVFGPDGDPLPPQIFAAATSEQPDAQVPFSDGPRIPADRIAAVLDAQTRGRLGSGRDGDEAWIHAMLGIGPRPEPATDDDLAAEGPDVEVIAFGREMMITSPAGATFLITEARSATPGSVHLRGPADEPLSLRDLVARLLDSVDRSDGGGTGANTGEVTLPDCKTRIEDDALIIDLPEVGAVHFVRGDPSAGQGPAVSVFMPDGDTATIDQLLGALSQGLASPQAAALRRQEAEAMAADRSYGDDPGPDVAGDDPTPAAPCRIPLSIRLPDELAAKAANVALLLIRGLPRGADLSAGVASGDGSWLLSPRDLVGLSLAPPPAWTVDLALEVAAIAVQDQDGGLASASQTLLVPPLSAPGGEPRAPIPIALDPQMLSAPEAPLDAIVIRLPAGATLSAGTYDAAIDGWVLLPPQMSGLTVKVDGEPAEDFTLTLLGISLSDGRARSRLLAQIPLAIR